MIMGVDSCSKGRGFESRRQIMDGLTFCTLIFTLTNCIDACLERPKKRKEAGVGSFFNKKVSGLPNITCPTEPTA